MPEELSPTSPDLSGWIRPGDGVVWSQACAEPVTLVDAFLTLAADVPQLSAFIGLSWRDLSAAVAPSLRVLSYGALGRLGRLAGLELVPCHFSALPALFAQRALPGDVALIQVAPPDRQGRCSLGVGVDYMADALAHARVVIAEVNDYCPRTAGPWVDLERIDAVVRSSRPLLEAPRSRPGALEMRIAGNVAALIEDGDTIQLGVGALPEAILGALASHRNLGVHSGMISDGVLDLIEGGVVTNARKRADRNLTVTGAALGSQRLFDALPDHEEILFAPVSYTHAPATLASVGRLAAINSALEVDLTGQVGAERASDRALGAVGGQVDFLRAAAINGGKAIVALPSARIVPALSGPVSTARSDVDWVVTEHGACSLRGRSEAARGRELLRVAGEAGAERLANLSPPGARSLTSR
jgi:acyl-CoA hydrolase